MILIDKYVGDQLLPIEKYTLDYIEGHNFTWKCNITTVASDNKRKYYAYFHNIVARHQPDKQEPGVIESPYAPILITMFKRLCETNGFKVNNIYRMAVNCTHYDIDEYCGIHRDHYFPHKVFIFYLNEVDYGYTYLFDEENGEPVYWIKPEKDKMIIFDDQYHAQGFCAPGQKRIVLVATFD